MWQVLKIFNPSAPAHTLSAMCDSCCYSWSSPNTTWAPHLNIVFWKISPRICPRWNASCKGNWCQHRNHHWSEESFKKVLKLQRKTTLQAQRSGNTYISSHLRFGHSSKAKNASKWFKQKCSATVNKVTFSSSNLFVLFESALSLICYSVPHNYFT